jgi:hypothetical protein
MEGSDDLVRNNFVTRDSRGRTGRVPSVTASIDAERSTGCVSSISTLDLLDDGNQLCAT